MDSEIQVSPLESNYDSISENEDIQVNGGNSPRDKIWRYPLGLASLFLDTRPLSFIITYVFISIFIFGLLVQIPKSVNNSTYYQKNNFVECTIGSLTSLNPIFVTQNPVDKDVQELIFQKLILIDKNTDPQPEIAQSWEISDDQKIFTFHIRRDLFWHDNQKLTAEDVKFTFDTAIKLAVENSQDTIGQALSNVQVSLIDDYTVQFTLSEVNATFFEAVSTYIIPEHAFKNVLIANIRNSSFNNLPIGSGPYKVKAITANNIQLEAFDKYPDPVKIKNFEYMYLTDITDVETAVRNNQVDAISGIDLNELGFLQEYPNFVKNVAPLIYRKKLLYLNNRDPELSNPSLRRALSYLTDKDKFISKAEVKGIVINGPINETSWAYNPNADYYKYSNSDAVKEFLDAGYSKNASTGYFESGDGKILSLELTYLEDAQNQKEAEILSNLWKQEGVILDLKPQTYDQLTREVIPTRNFQLLMYQIITTVDPDQYNLWHSIKVDYPNLNLSGYKLNRVDILLEKGRSTFDMEKRKTDYYSFQKYLMADAPVIFLYSPNYYYFVTKNLNGPSLTDIESASDRYLNVNKWEYVK